jgi:hypothetical protein
MRAERFFGGKPIAPPDETIATLTLARKRLEHEWPDTCPVVALWLTAETLISEPYRFLERALPMPWTSIPAYNDHRATVKADILSLYDHAIELAGRQA